MESLRTRPELRHELGERGHRAYVAIYTEEKHLARYYALIEELSRGRSAAMAGEPIR